MRSMTFAINGVDLSALCDQYGFSSGMTPVYSAEIETMDRKRHSTLVRWRGWCNVKLNDVSDDEARRFCYSFKPGEYDIKKTRKKRSLDANAYAWKLINDISLATRISPEEVYRNALLDIPTLYYIALIPDEYTDAAMTDWQKGHIGRKAEKEPAYTGYSNVFFHMGSSDFDTRQMSMLIDNLIQDCRALDIETRPQDEIEALLEAWDGR